MLGPQIFDGFTRRARERRGSYQEGISGGNVNPEFLPIADHVENVFCYHRSLPNHTYHCRPPGQDETGNVMIILDNATVS